MSEIRLLADTVVWLTNGLVQSAVKHAKDERRLLTLQADNESLKRKIEILTESGDSSRRVRRRLDDDDCNEKPAMATEEPAMPNDGEADESADQTDMNEPVDELQEVLR